MSINSAMYAAVTGLSALGTGMQTISNNIANVNTVGFKAGRTNYEDLISQNYFSGGRVNQRGCGVKVSSIQSMFTQGAFMSSKQDTDMAIAGEGFFSVRNTVTGATNYTRAGVFTLTKDGYMEDPSGNILQGWQMSIPKPGQPSIKIGAPTDIKIVVLNAPPVETSQIKIVTNLDADNKTAYKYEKYELADDWAKFKAEPMARSAEVAARDGYWNSADTGASIPGPLNNITPAAKTDYNQFFVEHFENLWGVTIGVSNLPNMWVVTDGTTITQTNRGNGWMTESEFNAYATAAEAKMKAQAAAKGLDAYTITHKTIYDAEYAAIQSSLGAEHWKLEGHGFAGAWDATKNPPIDTDNYNHPEPVTIYDSLGSEHKLMVYYQKNPHMENVWDYIITCDPIEDARKDGNNSLLYDQGSTFSGLIQKGKITFTADGADRHGGVIKDIEAQNLDLNNTKMSTIEEPKASASATAIMRNAVIGGYYTGSPVIDPQTGVYGSSSRTYTLTWGADDGTGNWSGNIPGNPPRSGMTWVDSLTGETRYIPITDVNHPGPYEFGSGLTVTFDHTQTPLNFGVPGKDSITVKTNSEQLAWANLAPNDQGYFDFDVAFVQSASMALHPPYPGGMPTVVQNIAFDMGAKYNGSNPKWVLDELSTTQYASHNATMFSGQDGYPSGSLQRVSIGEDGVVTGVYSNGRHQPLYQIGLTRFLNPWGLSKEGDNLFAETRYSGSGAFNEPGYGGTGTVLANFLEQSNVDLAEEIVNMIITQRGFQANSKTVTTTDTMLAEVIEMKR